MSKKRKNLILLVSITLLIGLALWLIMRDDATDFTNDNDGHVSDSDDSSHSGILIDEKQEDLKKIVFSNENASYNVTVDAKKGSVEFAELKGLPVNENFMEYIWYGVAQMGYNRIITSTKSENYKASDYGLNKPSLTVTAVFGSDKKYKFYAGNQVAGEENNIYYVRLEGDSNIYSCTIDVSFFMGNSYYLSNDVFYSYDNSLESQSDVTIGDITITGDKFDGKFVMKRNKTSNKSDPLYGYDYVATSPVSWPIKSNSAALTVHELTYLTADEAVVLNPTKSQLKKYGFDTPSCTISFKRNGKACTLYIGNISKDTAYMMLKGQPIIYSINTDGLSMLHKLEPNVLYNDKALSFSVDTVSSITIKSANLKRKITVSRKSGNNDANALDDTPIYTYTAYADGNEIKYSTYANFVKQINNAVVPEWNTKKPSGKPALTMTVSYYDNYSREDDVISFYKISERVYSVVYKDFPVNQISANWVNQLLKNTESL